MVDLTSHVALVTGAESGIGAACAVALAAAGADIAILYHRDRTAAERTLETVLGNGARGFVIQTDVTREDQVHHAFDQANATLGRPDILVNSAGLNQAGVPVADMTTEQWRRLIDTDLTGAFFFCRRFVRDLRDAGEPGRIVNISSIHQHVVRAGAADYAAAKAGLHKLTETLALECAPLKIKVNAVAPGMILTPMNAAAMGNPALMERDRADIPLGRPGTAEEVAGVVVFLASPEADYITGTTITIDGGLSLVLGQGA
ncbi:MAG TPA: SDR family oxidoreductase [Bauldia sp.]|nr:SDR family oxidoreductase [Bauldia sp.]